MVLAAPYNFMPSNFSKGMLDHKPFQKRLELKLLKLLAENKSVVP